MKKNGGIISETACTQIKINSVVYTSQLIIVGFCSLGDYKKLNL
jgi:hypothetical protein